MQQIRQHSVMTPAALYQRLYFSTVETKLATARLIHDRLGPLLASDPEFGVLIANLNAQAQKLAQCMAGIEMGPLCTRCASAAGGGCCSAFMAGECDALQILLNLHAGVALPEADYGSDHCLFLGSTGCIFAYKPMFCLNYNCHHIHQTATSAQMIELEAASARLLTRQNLAENYLFEIIQKERIQFEERSRV